MLPFSENRRLSNNSNLTLYGSKPRPERGRRAGGACPRTFRLSPDIKRPKRFIPLVQQGLKTRFPDRPRTTGLLASGRPFEIARNRVWQNEPNPSGSSRICP
ncbi:MAG: hypothetical protein P4M06_05305, partial [Pandoraea sp.]